MLIKRALLENNLRADPTLRQPLETRTGPGQAAGLLPSTASGDTKVVTVQQNKPSHLMFSIPNLTDGTYHLEVRARMGSATSARELPIRCLDSPLTVVPT